MAKVSATHGYEIKSAVDFFIKLLDEREDFLKNPLSSRHAINGAFTAWHLYEWVYHDYKDNEFMKQFVSSERFRDWFLKQEMEFSLIRDLADGSKHFLLGRKDKTVIKTQLMRQGEKIGPTEIKQDTLYVMMTYYNGARMSFDDILYITTIFWYEFFREKLGVDTSKILEEGGYTYF